MQTISVDSEQHKAHPSLKFKSSKVFVLEYRKKTFPLAWTELHFDSKCGTKSVKYNLRTNNLELCTWIFLSVWRIHEFIKCMGLVNSFCMRNLDNSVQTIHFSSCAHMCFMGLLLFLLNSDIHIVYFLTTKQIAGEDRCFVFVSSLWSFLPYTCIYLFCAKGLHHVKKCWVGQLERNFILVFMIFSLSYPSETAANYNFIRDSVIIV